jgi:pimeloyl-ACP methyl ester carboxylesterase
MRKTLVMIPAFGCDGGLYAEVVAGLDVEIVTHIAGEDSFEGMVKALLAKAPEEFIVLGTSMGGRLALEVALAAPDRVEGLVVIGAGAGGVADPAAGLRRSARLRGGEMEDVLSEMGDMVAHLPGPRGGATRQAFIEMGRKMGADVMAQQSDALAKRVDRWERLAEIKCPTLCLWGEHDQFSPAADGRRLAEAVDWGVYVELPGCGHFPTLEFPVEATAILRDWLDEEFDD